MNGMLLEIIGQIDDDLIEEAREPRAPRRKRLRGKGWLAAAACLCLFLGAALILPRQAENVPWQTGSDAGTLDGCTMPGGIEPTLWWQGRAFTWADVVHVPDLEEWTPLGELAGVSDDETVREDLWLYAGFSAEGTVYSSELYPDVLYVLMTTDWLEDIWVRFTVPELRDPLICWDGRLYRASAASYPDVNALKALPEGYAEAGRVDKTSEDKAPDETGETTGWYYGSTVWVNPEQPNTIYLQVIRSWSGSSYTAVYAPAHALTEEQAGELTIPPEK